jgi:hypothetical protein
MNADAGEEGRGERLAQPPEGIDIECRWRDV